MVNQKYLDKAEVLIEALPYIQRFNRKIVVVKSGGSDFHGGNKPDVELGKVSGGYVPYEFLLNMKEQRGLM